MKGIYTHQVQYYETDKMRIVHHSNYIRWFEEARTYGIREDGFGYDEMEARGVLIPVLSVSCEYKTPVTFGQTVYIEYELAFFDGLRFGINYRVLSRSGNGDSADRDAAKTGTGRDVTKVSTGNGAGMGVAKVSIVKGAGREMIKVSEDRDTGDGGNAGSDSSIVLHAKGETRHCFLDDRLRILNVKRYAPDIYEYFKNGCVK